MKLAFRSLSARHPAARADAPAALRSLTLDIRSGEQVAVIGPSGAGKTTLLHTAAAALPPSEGEVLIDGHQPWRLPAGELRRLRGRLFLAPQVPPLPARQRVVTAVLAARLPAISLWRSLRSLFYPDDIEGAWRAIDRFGLGEKLFDRVDRLSGGERQRVGLARALISPASLWLIDEPLSALDPTRAAQAIGTLVESARQRQATLVATLHQVDTALAHFPRIVGLRDGALFFDLPSAQVSRQLLAQLYAQFEHELLGAATAPAEPAPAAAAPATMHCR
ncbi:MAG: ATP-binding cassette domain-containing protein [Rubrivivax sp.]|nr:ATP-binding cassette domain-containing protein [Rubrivivax sp.]